MISAVNSEVVAEPNNPKNIKKEGMKKFSDDVTYLQHQQSEPFQR